MIFNLSCEEMLYTLAIIGMGYTELRVRMSKKPNNDDKKGLPMAS